MIQDNNLLFWQPQRPFACFYPHSQFNFYADAVGEHILSYSLNGQSSDQVTINVTAYVPPLHRRTLHEYHYNPQSYYYPGHNYPGYIYRSYRFRFYGDYGWNSSNLFANSFLFCSDPGIANAP